MQQVLEEKSSGMQKNIVWGLRIILAALFIVSAVGKIYWDPSTYTTLTAFEAKQLVQQMGFDPNFAQWFSRTLIGCELALGLLLLQRHFYARLIITVSSLMLLIFIIHLSYDMSVHGNKGNCGCFGALIEMTPLEAIIKNIIALIALGYLYYKRKVVNEGNNFWVLTTTTFFSIMLIFMVGMPKSSIGAKQQPTEDPIVENVPDDSNTQEVQDADTAKTITPGKTDSVKVEKVAEPKPKKSGYANLYPGIDKGRKILCFFAPGCEHCQQTIKDLTAMSKQIKDFPEIKIVFIEEETELIPGFFAQAGKTYPYIVKDPGAFFTILGAANTPMVNYLWNGNKIKVYEGTEESGTNYFKAKEFKSIVQKKYEDLK